MKVLAIGLTIALSLPGGAEACSGPSYAESGQSIDTTHLAADMVSAAASVDLVEIVGAEPIDPVAFFARERAEALAEAQPEYLADVNSDYDAYEAMYRRSGAATITYRVVEHFKGSSEVDFSLTGFFVRPGDELYAALSPALRGEPRTRVPPGSEVYNRHTVELKDWGGTGSCAAPLIAVEGVRYLLFRDADGGLLPDGYPLPNRPRLSVAQGVYGVVAEPANEGDAWLEAVKTAARR